jgi:ammonia channel protein AmtB
MNQTWITIKTICVGIVIATILMGILAYFVGIRITTQRELDRIDRAQPVEQLSKM